MADQTNDTQSKINQEDRDIQKRQHDTQGQKADDFQGGSSGMPGGSEAEGRFARQGETPMGGSMAGQTAGSSANPATGAGGAQTGAVDRGGDQGSMSGTTGTMTSGSAGGQSAGSVGTIGGSESDTRSEGERSQSSQQGSPTLNSDDVGEPGSRQGAPLGAGHQNSADGGSVTAAGSSSTGPGAGQAGTDRGGGFVGSSGNDSGDYLQERDPQQAGFAEQGRGAPDDGTDIERGRERSANERTDIEGSSNS